MTFYTQSVSAKTVYMYALNNFHAIPTPSRLGTQNLQEINKISKYCTLVFYIITDSLDQ